MLTTSDSDRIFIERILVALAPLVDPLTDRYCRAQKESTRDHKRGAPLRTARRSAVQRNVDRSADDLEH